VLDGVDQRGVGEFTERRPIERFEHMFDYSRELARQQRFSGCR